MKLEQMLKKFLKEIVEEVEFEKVTEYDWIPVSKGYPKKEGFYLVTMRCKFRDKYDYIVATTHYSTLSDNFMINHHEIIAWMPLPPPYKENNYIVEGVGRILPDGTVEALTQNKLYPNNACESHCEEYNPENKTDIFWAWNNSNIGEIV